MINKTHLFIEIAFTDTSHNVKQFKEHIITSDIILLIISKLYFLTLHHWHGTIFRFNVM